MKKNITLIIFMIVLTLSIAGITSCDQTPIQPTPEGVYYQTYKIMNANIPEGDLDQTGIWQEHPDVKKTAEFIMFDVGRDESDYTTKGPWIAEEKLPEGRIAYWRLDECFIAGKFVVKEKGGDVIILEAPEDISMFVSYDQDFTVDKVTVTDLVLEDKDTEGCEVSTGAAGEVGVQGWSGQPYYLTPRERQEQERGGTESNEFSEINFDNATSLNEAIREYKEENTF